MHRYLWYTESMQLTRVNNLRLLAWRNEFHRQAAVVLRLTPGLYEQEDILLYRKNLKLLYRKN